MGSDPGVKETRRRGRPGRVALVGLVKVGAFTVAEAAVLFISAGRLDWAIAWAYMGLLVASTVVATLVVDRELLVERAGVGEGVKGWDIPLVLVMARGGPLATLLVAGLDRRFGWSPPLPMPVAVAALAATALAAVLTIWAMAANRFFSGVVRIQAERGHTAVTGGPYRWVRHPGYAATILASLAGPLVLGSLWALIPGGLTGTVIVIRTALEDRTLWEELAGYREYTQRVRYRLLPGVW